MYGICTYIHGAEATCVFMLVSSGKETEGADGLPTQHNGASVLWKDLTAIQQFHCANICHYTS